MKAKRGRGRAGKLKMREAWKVMGIWTEVVQFREGCRRVGSEDCWGDALAQYPIPEAVYKEVDRMRRDKMRGVRANALTDEELEAAGERVEIPVVGLAVTEDLDGEADWVASNIDEARPGLAPCRRAWAMLKWAKGSPDKFWPWYLGRKTVKPKAEVVDLRDMSLEDLLKEYAQ
mgnify:CR=1 FL=1